MTTDEQRMPFYVTERLNGQNLRVVIEKKGSLKLTHCYRIAIDVLDALEHAHENSVIRPGHRDVKPEKSSLHRNANGTNTTKLLDFGMSGQVRLSCVRPASTSRREASRSAKSRRHAGVLPSTPAPAAVRTPPQACRTSATPRSVVA